MKISKTNIIFKLLTMVLIIMIGLLTAACGSDSIERPDVDQDMSSYDTGSDEREETQCTNSVEYTEDVENNTYFIDYEEDYVIEAEDEHYESPVEIAEADEAVPKDEAGTDSSRDYAAEANVRTNEVLFTVKNPKVGATEATIRAEYKNLKGGRVTLAGCTGIRGSCSTHR